MRAMAAQRRSTVPSVLMHPGNLGVDHVMQYNVTLRAEHNDCDPEVILSAVGLPPLIVQKKGVHWLTPNGSLSRYPGRKTRIHFEIAKSDDGDLSEEIESFCEYLSNRTTEILNIISLGVDIDVSIGIFVVRMDGFILSIKSMKALSGLKIPIGLSLYEGDRTLVIE
jgi:hypothetical protein